MPQSPIRAAGPPTALEIVDRILADGGVAARPRTIDRIVAGDPTTFVTGVATMAIASLDGLRAAAAAGRNLVVAYDGPFWSETDDLERMTRYPGFAAKRDFLRAKDMVVLHLREHLRDRVPDVISLGMARTLGWEDRRAPGCEADRFVLPPTTLLGLARELAGRLDDRTLRVVGDPQLAVSRVAASWGNAAQLPTIRLFNSEVDVVLCGYTREWEAVEYAQDMIATGLKKGLILLGHAKSVEGGMRACAEWLTTLVPEVPVEFLAQPEPYWTPKPWSR
ncbi:Nif3-like dinuclear metal center hexameric protein [Sphingomonas quercus]|uniref:Nif3-like dinuclear metal center hexameric protein n=1 Tax=Sphingomonas quercus TaxID=2842451 RepID=A0ABS6BJJ2_9SPHN|nr:Nif3-like dinuclear metal center hexameric protein [Sphingomonas quercus]MBU3077365.1 Nif3-like dinuclear metal center hexameric protein [Sphingomonas quercus]